MSHSSQSRPARGTIAHQPARGVDLRTCCARIGVSYRTGRRYVADGRFPIPELRRITPRSPHRFSTVDIEAYLRENATAEVR